MNLFSYLFRQSRALTLSAALAGLIAGISSAGIIAVIGEAVGSLARSASVRLLALEFFALCIVSLFARSWSEIALLKLTQTMMFEMRVMLSRRIVDTPLKKLQSIGKSGLLAILTNDVATFTGASRLLPRIFSDAIVIASCLAYMAWLSWQVLIVFIVFLVIGIGTFTLAERVPRSAVPAIRDQIDHLYAHFRSLVEGSKELQLSLRRRSIFIDEVLAPGADTLRRLFIHTMSRYTLVINAGGILFYLVLGAILFATPAILPAQTGVLPTIVFLLLFLVQPISELMLALPEASQAAVALTRIRSLETTLQTSEDDVACADASWSQPLDTLELAGVSHVSAGAEDEKFTLGPLDLTIVQGEVLFIIGGNGSGKTTLALLLLGLYPPDSGTIRLNGASVTPANVDHYRQRFSAVFADFYLFEQMLGASEHAKMARASAYLDKLGLAGKVKVVNGKLSTTDLSTGQRKRLALVSSYLDDRDIYLFDEWAADQDPSFKRVFYKELLPELKARGKTVIVITHDDGYFDCADRVLKLDAGQLIETSHLTL
jgi:putative pyoverdin transport system ATP-binding/permease protein